MAKHLTLNIVQPAAQSPQVQQGSLTILSWNVNGYTVGIHEWLLGLIQRSHIDIIFLSETKKREEELNLKFAAFTNYNVIINAHEPARYHGVAMLIRKEHQYVRIPIQMGIAPRSDTKVPEAATGRIIAVQMRGLNIIGSYTPNSSGALDETKLTYRVRTWDPAFAQILEQLRANAPTVWMGDINVAPTDLDISNPGTMRSWAGCSPQERANFATLIGTGNWVDVWRYQHPQQRGYSWVGSTRRPNYGMRLDNIIVSAPLLERVTQTIMISECPISDHIPVGAQII
jgi:exodeoxyribonuclease-3